MPSEQWSTGLCNVTNSSQVVIGTASCDWANQVAVSHVFKIDEDAAPSYVLASVISASRIILNANYAGTTGTGLSYIICRSFTTNQGWWRCLNGDADFADLLSQLTIDKIDTDLAAIDARLEDVELDAIAADIIVINASIDALQANMINANASIGALRTNIVNANASIGTWNTNLTRANASIDALQSNMINANASIGSLMVTGSQIVRVNASIDALQANVVNANASIGALSLTTVNASISDLQTNVVNVNASIGALQTNVVNANASIGGAKTNVVNANATIGDLQTNVIRANASIDVLQTNVINANASIGAIVWNATIIANINASITSVQNNVINANASITPLQTNMINANASIGTLQTNTVNANASIGSLKTNVTNVNASLAYYKEEFVPVEWGKNASWPPGAAEDIMQSYRTVVVRKFAGSTVDEKLSFVLRAPRGIQTTTVQYSPHVIITGTVPSSQGVVFGLKGHSKAVGASYGSEVLASKINLTGTLNPKYSQLQVGWSSAVTVASLEGGRLAFFEFIRRQSNADDDYATDIGVPGFDIRWI